MNDDIIFFLENLKVDLDNDQKSKKIAYSKIISIIKDLDYQIKINTKLSDIKGIGKKTEDKIKEFLRNELNKPIDLKKEFQKQLIKITGIGPKKAKDISTKVSSFEELYNNQNHLNNKQKLGLKYFKTDNLRISRKEMTEHDNFISTIIKGINPNIKFQIVGSYRRQQKDSGDIDLILTYKSNILQNIISNFVKKEYIIDIYANGNKKFMGWCKLPNSNISRRLDILYTCLNEYPFSLLYFTGSKNYNKFMRSIAIKKKMTLNEHGLFFQKDKININHNFTSEQDIFDYLEIEYKSPFNRI